MFVYAMETSVILPLSVIVGSTRAVKLFVVVALEHNFVFTVRLVFWLR